MRTDKTQDYIFFVQTLINFRFSAIFTIIESIKNEIRVAFSEYLVLFLTLQSILNVA